jgi:hypothetical protein
MQTVQILVIGWGIGLLIGVVFFKIKDWYDERHLRKLLGGRKIR